MVRHVRLEAVVQPARAHLRRRLGLLGGVVGGSSCRRTNCRVFSITYRSVMYRVFAVLVFHLQTSAMLSKVLP